MWSICVTTVANSIKRNCYNNEQEDGSTNEQEDRSTNEVGSVIGWEISTVEGAAFTIVGYPVSNVEGLGRMQLVAEV